MIQRHSPAAGQDGDEKIKIMKEERKILFIQTAGDCGKIKEKPEKDQYAFSGKEDLYEKGNRTETAVQRV